MSLVGFTGVVRFIAVDLTIEVDQYLRGDGPSTLVVRDERSVEPGSDQAVTSAELDRPAIADVDQDALVFSGAAGACGALTSNPVGQYWVAGFTRDARGRWQAGLPTIFGVGDGPDDPNVIAGRTRFAIAAGDTVGGVQPAASGMAGLAAPARHANAAPAAAGVLIAVMLVAGARQWPR